MSDHASAAVLVWDRWIRLGHWALAFLVAASWLTRHGGGVWHEYLGYAALLVAVLRIGRGLLGHGHDRFDDFLRSPAAAWHYVRLLLRHREPRFLGHNPLGGYMIVALLAAVLAVAASGWLYTTDRYWGVAWVELLHAQLSNLLLAMIALHVLGVLHMSVRQRENLVASMLHGRKRRHARTGDERPANE